MNSKQWKKSIIKEKIDIIKIIDEDNFICSKGNKKLCNINVKANKITTLLNINEDIEHILYYKKNKIIVIFDLICGFKIWEIIKDSINNSTTYQVMTKLNFIEIENNDIAEMNLVKKKNENIY